MLRFFTVFVTCAAALAGQDSGFNGRWNISVRNEPRNRAWWLEIEGAGTDQLRGRFVGAPGGQMDTIPKLRVENGELKFWFERQYARGNAGNTTAEYAARLVDGKLEGRLQVPAANIRLDWTGVRAPEIRETEDGSWKPKTPVELFNGRDLSGWQSRIPGRPVQWFVKDALLSNEKGAADIVSTDRFWNFDLHVEYRIGKGSNSGIGLRGRYEIQIYDDYGKPASLHGNGAVYSRILPSENASLPPGEWQTFDIRLIGRTVTVKLNGKTIIDRKQIEGLTAIANDPDEARPGPLVLQGDHGPVEFRKITLTPLER